MPRGLSKNEAQQSTKLRMTVKAYSQPFRLPAPSRGIYVNAGAYAWPSHSEERTSKMPLYTITTEEGALSGNQRDQISSELVRIHTEVMHVPAHFVHAIFSTYPQRNGYVAGKAAAVASIAAIIRAGHSSEEKVRLIKGVWAMFQNVAGTSDSDLSVALQEVPASQAMENGIVMPEIGGEGAAAR
jgi:phenylpyruvate tautomerase PptA (4-oxalocrotonate tautomerase family)